MTMTIEIGWLDHSTHNYYVQITERIEEDSNDLLHHVDRVTTSPALLSEFEARRWLTQWLAIT